MFKPPLKKTYRVLEVIESGKRKFFPQQRHLFFFWKKIVQEGYEYLKEEFDTLEEANECLYKRHTQDLNNENVDDARRRIKKLDTKIYHPFDAVFHKLKRTDNSNQDR